MERYLTAAVRLLFRADAAFAKPEIYDYLEARNIGYAIRLRSNFQLTPTVPMIGKKSLIRWWSVI